MMGSDAAFAFLGALERPVSLGSMEIMRRLGISVMKPDHELDYAQELGEIAIFTWLHTAPLADIHRALWLGTWHDELVAPDGEYPTLVAAFRADRDLLSRAISHVHMRVRAKPGTSNSDVPNEVVPPTLHEHRLFVLMNTTHQTREQLEYRTGIITALQMYHASRWHEGAWTVRVVDTPEVAEAAFEGFDFPADIDTPEPA